MNKYIFGGVLCAMFFALCSFAQAQQPKVYRVQACSSRARIHTIN